MKTKDVPKDIPDEILDIVDENDKVISQGYKKNIHENHLLHRASHVIVSYKNYVFLQLRSKNKQQFPNKWDISAAGHVITQESYINCAIRELQEELGLTTSKQKLIEVNLLPASEKTGFEFIKIFHLEFYTLPNITLQKKEISTGGWFDKSHVTFWLNQHPEDFAGCFNLIWNYCSATC